MAISICGNFTFLTITSVRWPPNRKASTSSSGVPSSSNQPSAEISFHSQWKTYAKMNGFSEIIRANVYQYLMVNNQHSLVHWNRSRRTKSVFRGQNRSRRTKFLRLIFFQFSFFMLSEKISKTKNFGLTFLLSTISFSYFTMIKSGSWLFNDNFNFLMLPYNFEFCYKL